jgi:GT2 family glycosyltransferase
MTQPSGVRRPVPVSVIVCVRNRDQALAHCLRALKTADPAEVIVVDGASTDRTVDVATAAGFRVVSDGGAGLGAARQLGAEVATNPYVAFVDSDVVLEPQTLELLQREAETNGWDAVQARMVGPQDRPSYWQRGEAWRRSVQDQAGIADAIGCLATLIRRDLVLEVGFDPAFSGAAEDGDFFFRARKAGARIAFSSSAVAHHDDRRGFLSFAKQRIWHGRGIARVLIRHRHAFRSSASSHGGSALINALRHPRYMLFMAVSVAFLAIGLAAEAVRIGVDRQLGVALRLRE